jgi:hypothetical protein
MLCGWVNVVHNKQYKNINYASGLVGHLLSKSYVPLSTTRPIVLRSMALEVSYVIARLS